MEMTVITESQEQLYRAILEYAGSPAILLKALCVADAGNNHEPVTVGDLLTAIDVVKSTRPPADF